MFCDELKIKVFGGKGGNGCLSFRREKYVPRGGPDGGDGGRGGSIIIKINQNLNTLSALAHKKSYEAPNGGNGLGQNMYGKNGENLVLEVPLGTVIYNFDKSEILADLSTVGVDVVVAKGGKGGMGNKRFVSATHQAPKFAENGEPGEEKKIILELKLVADVGLIGLPSVGKSTIISVISNARPKIAAYHFTTLIPNLGVVEMSKFGGDMDDSFIVADIPGLIEGASQGKGLGVQFLKHVTRTKLLVHIADATLENLDKNYKVINKELKEFDKTLAKREQIMVLNKIDLLSEEEVDKKIAELKKVCKKNKIFAISAAAHKGLPPLMFEISKKLKEIKNKERAVRFKKPRKEEIHVLKPHLNKVKFTIEKIIYKKNRKIFRLRGKRLEQLLIMTDIQNPEGVERIYHFFGKMGVTKTVEKLGAQTGDVIRIKDKDIPYRP